MTIFFTSDSHFGHVNILKFEAEARPFDNIKEMNEALVDRWNKIVGHQDTVWHLGDAVFGAQNAWYLGRLNGQKRLVMGNHDRLDMQTYLKYFTKVYGCASLDITREDRIIMTHVPVHEAQLAHRFQRNLHGHMHSKKLPDPRYINVSVEQNNLYPISLDEILERRT